MAAIVRVGDINAGGGAAIVPRVTVLSSGKPLAGFASKVTPHPCCGVRGCEIHCVASIVPSPSTVLASGLPVHKVGNIDTCGHPRATGDLRVLVLS